MENPKIVAPRRWNVVNFLIIMKFPNILIMIIKPYISLYRYTIKLWDKNNYLEYSILFFNVYGILLILNRRHISQ